MPVLAAAMLVAACGAASTNGDARASNKEARMQDSQKVAAAIGVTFPPAATVEHADLIEGRDNAARASLEMSADDWQAWRAALIPAASKVPPFSADEAYLLYGDVPGWAPSKAAGLRAVQLPWRGGVEALNLGYAPAGEGRVRVFLFWHQT